MVSKTAWLYIIAISLQELLRSEIAGESHSVALSDEEYEVLMGLVMRHPMIARRYHNPSTCKRTWLDELTEVIDDLREAEGQCGSSPNEHRDESTYTN